MVNESENGVDGRVTALPVGAVNLGARITQIARQKRRGKLVKTEVVITDDSLLLFVDGRAEMLGAWKE